MIEPHGLTARDFSDQFLRVMAKFNALERRPRSFGTKEKLFRAEIHAIDAIGSHEGSSVTALAEIMGVTKGAVSQMVDKLLLRGFVTKTALTGIANEVKLDLTKKGWTAFRAHAELHRDLLAAAARRIGALSRDERSAIWEIYAAIEAYLDRRVTEDSPP